MRFVSLLLALLLGVWPAAAQTLVDLTNQGKLASGPTVPARCVLGQVFFRTGVAAGQNLYACTATNTWALQAGGSQVNADWTAGSGPAAILNKPTLGGAAALNVGSAAGTVAPGNAATTVNGVPCQLGQACTVAGGGSPGGPDNSIQTNVSGSLGGSGNFGYDRVKSILGLTGGINSAATNPNVLNDPNNAVGYSYSVTYDRPSLVNPGFPNTNLSQWTINAINGQLSPGGKSTFSNLYTLNKYAGGQAIWNDYVLNCWGMSDCAKDSITVNFAQGPIGGDETSAANNSVSYIRQLGTLAQATILSVDTNLAQGCNTTTTQAITASTSIQTVTVSDSTGCAPGGYVIIAQAPDNGTPNLGWTLITASAAGSISGIFMNNQSSGVTVTPAKLLTVSNTQFFGQGRVLVDLNGATWNAGNVSSITGGEFIGTGTGWANNMVGGNAANIGAIELISDRVTVNPFVPCTTIGVLPNCLKSWYQITTIIDATHLGIHSFSAAADASYRGIGAPSSYNVFPAARILGFNGNQLILETSTHTWTVGDVVECATSPFPDAAAEEWNLDIWTPGYTPRPFRRLVNNGARTWGPALQLDQIMPAGGNNNVEGFQNIIVSLARTSFGAINIFGQDTTGGLLFKSTFGAADPGKFTWQSATGGGLLQMSFLDNAGPAGLLQFNTGGKISSMDWTGCGQNGGNCIYTTPPITGVLAVYNVPGPLPLITVPAAVNDEQDIGSYNDSTTVTNGGCWVLGAMATNGPGSNSGKLFQFCKSVSTGGWVVVPPVSSDPKGSDDYAIDFNYNPGATAAFRVRKISGTNTMNLFLNLQQVTVLNAAGTGLQPLWTSSAAGPSTVTPPTAGLSSALRFAQGANPLAFYGSCTAALEGITVPVSDSSTTTWGGAITGGSSSHVGAYCNGSAWTVAAK